MCMNAASADSITFDHKAFFRTGQGPRQNRCSKSYKLSFVPIDCSMISVRFAPYSRRRGRVNLNCVFFCVLFNKIVIDLKMSTSLFYKHCQKTQNSIDLGISHSKKRDTVARLDVEKTRHGGNHLALS